MANYSINFAPLAVSGQTNVLIGRQPFDDGHLRDLRSEFLLSHVFRRDGDFIVDVPILPNVEPIGNLQEEIDLADNTMLLPGLFSAALVRAFAGQREILSDRPVSVMGAASRGLIMHPDLPSWIQKRTMLRFDTRSIFAGKRWHGVVCEARSRNLILGTCADLLAKGVSLEGRYIQIEEPANDARLMKRRRLVGRVHKVQGDTLFLEDSADGFETVHSQDAYLEGRREVLSDCVRQILGRNADRVLHVAEVQESTLHAGPTRMEAIELALDYLRRTKLEAVPGVTIEIGARLSSQGRAFPKFETIPKPVLVYDPSGTRKDSWAERGIKQHGPYDQRTFTPKALNIAVICQARHEGQVDSFVAKFLDGMPDVVSGKNREARYGDGFLRRYALERPRLEFFTAPTAATNDYIVASRTALAKASDEGFSWDLVLVQVEEEFKGLADGGNPYFATKSTFLKRGVPVQSVLLETMGQPDAQLVFALNHMSLATYAKIGGTPWLLASPQTVAHELVIGLGSHSVSTSRIGSRKRFVGITTVFSSDGSHGCCTLRTIC